MPVTYNRSILSRSKVSVYVLPAICQCCANASAADSGADVESRPSLYLTIKDRLIPGL